MSHRVWRLGRSGIISDHVTEKEIMARCAVCGAQPEKGDEYWKFQEPNKIKNILKF